MDKLGSADSYTNKIDGTFVKQIRVGGIIGATFITIVGAHWIIPHKKSPISL